MSARRTSIQAELEQVSGNVLTPVRWVVLLGILASLPLRFRLAIDRPAIIGAVVVYAVVAAGLPRLYRRPFTPYAIARLLLVADFLFSAAVFHFSAGVRSPYFGLWYIALIHAALLLGPNAALGISMGVAALIVTSELVLTGSHGASLRTLDFSLGKLPFLPLIAWAAGRLAQEIRDREAARRQAERRALTLEAEEARLRNEMEIARRVQESLLPIAPSTPPEVMLATFSRPAREVGGDTYEVVELPDGRLLVAIADVSGKGVPAALLVVAVQQGIRQYAGPDPAAVLAGVNRLLLESTPDEMFVTAACVVIDPRDGTAMAAAAGHPPPFWWDHVRQRLVPLSVRGPALGLVPEWSGSTERWPMAPGDTLLLYTDGVLDAKIDEHERLGEERLAELLARTPPEGAQEWVERLRGALNHCMEWPDDVTFVAIERLSSAAAWDRLPSVPEGARHTERRSWLPN
jgi:serine phosphatase RsbU (regulator of sigma subunit)